MHYCKVALLLEDFCHYSETSKTVILVKNLIGSLDVEEKARKKRTLLKKGIKVSPSSTWSRNSDVARAKGTTWLSRLLPSRRRKTRLK
jgi:hypothetical protein